MKLNKKIILLCLVLTIAVPSQSGLFGGGGSKGLGKIVKLLESIDSATGKNGTATLAELESKLQLIKQTEMQIEQLRVEMENFKQLGDDVKNLDIDKITNLLNKTVGYKDYATTTVKQLEKNLDGFFSDYDGTYNLDKYGYDIKDLEKQRTQLRKYEADMQKMVYNNMAKNQMYASIGDQGNDLKRRIGTLNSAAGTLQALQAIGGILSQTNQILLETKQMLATNMEMKDRIETQMRKEESIGKDNQESFNETSAKKWKEESEALKKDAKKTTKIKIDFKSKKK